MPVVATSKATTPNEIRAGLSSADRGQKLSNRLPGPLRRLARSYSDWNWAWRTDVALRHRPVEDALRAAGYLGGGRPARIVDVGCGSQGGVAGYMPVRTIGVDLHFNVERIRRHPQVTPVVGSGLALPLADRCCDVAISMDTLEHLTPPARAALVRELFRVVRDRGLVICGAPCGSAARAAEERINAAYRARTGRDHPWLIEHLENELLTAEALQELLAAAAGQRFARFDLKMVPNTNLAVWERFQQERWLKHLHRPIYRLLWPWFRDRHEPPVYRQVCIVHGLT